MPKCFHTIYHTPPEFDDLVLTGNDTTLFSLTFANSDGYKIHNQDISEENDLPIFKETAHWLDIYFSGHQPDFTPNFHIQNATPFRQEVSEIMLTIPYGKVLTYGEIAKIIAKKHGLKKMSAQAVGGAVGWNSICIIIPCHRVLGVNNSLTGYTGGIHNKQSLLNLENLRVENAQKISFY